MPAPVLKTPVPADMESFGLVVKVKPVGAVTKTFDDITMAPEFAILDVVAVSPSVEKVAPPPVNRTVTLAEEILLIVSMKALEVAVVAVAFEVTGTGETDPTPPVVFLV